jgi:peptidyl-prolyl cis-trans isomerase C
MRIKNREMLGFALLAFALACSTGRSDKSIVARVGNAVLTQESLEKNMRVEGVLSGQENVYIEKWVNRELLAMEAKKQGLDKSTEFKNELKTLESEILIQKLLEKVFAEQIHFSDKEIESYYKQNRDLFILPEEEIHLLHILVKTQLEANQALQEIRAGKSFNTVAKERSVDSFRNKGGDMDLIRKGDVIPELARIAFSLPESTIPSVLQTSYGFHIFRVVKRYKTGDPMEFNDAKSEVLKRLRVTKERSIYRELLYQLQNKYKIYVTPIYETIPSGADKIN